MTELNHAIPVESFVSGSVSPRRWERVVGPVLVALALLSAFATFVVLAGLTQIAPTHDVVIFLLSGNIIALAALGTLITWEAWKIFQARRRGQAAARLHVRTVALFSLIAAMPAILVAVVASVTVDRGLDQLFSRQTRTLVENSMHVAEAYVNEHAALVRGDMVAMAIDLTRARPVFDQDKKRFHDLLNAQAGLRGFATAQLMTSDLTVIDQADRKVDVKFALPAREMIGNLPEGEPQVAVFLDADYVAAIVKLRDYSDTVLYVARLLDPKVMAQLRATRQSLTDYAVLEQRRGGVMIAFALMYGVIALVVLLSAVWIGINFANYLVAPIRRIIGAAQLVSAGNLSAQVPTTRSEGDLAQLGTTFNKMTQDLRTQRDDIVRARDLIDSRRRFTEAVLAGASASIIGIDPEGRVSILNRSAEELIGVTEADALGRPLLDLMPELSELLQAARTGLQRVIQRQVTINRSGREHVLQVRLTTEQTVLAEHGYVVTIDDITELVAAQRTSAWADIARRIAHEIKNPLTPIQLSAERLRRKYAASIKDDPAVFLQCTDTIVRQVDDIKRMVDEFSRFARMPRAVVAEEDVADIVKQTVFLMRVGLPDIDIDVDIAEEPMPAQIDRRLISQALTNIIKNAGEAIAAVPDADLGRGHIRVAVAREGGDVVIDVIDNGIGLPKESRNRLLEPYVTTREKGTGLGLAIVGRILEEHGGKIELNDASLKVPDQRGAWVRLRFAAAPVVAKTDERTGERTGAEEVPELRKVVGQQ